MKNWNLQMEGLGLVSPGAADNIADCARSAPLALQQVGLHRLVHLTLMLAFPSMEQFLQVTAPLAR